MPSCVWFDVEDLFDYAEHNPRPSGIQRLTFEVYRALEAASWPEANIRFARHDPETGFLKSVEWSEITALYEPLMRGTPANCGGAGRAGMMAVVPTPPPPAAEPPAFSSLFPVSTHVPLQRFRFLQGAALREFKKVLSRAPGPSVALASKSTTNVEPFASRDATGEIFRAGAGDVLVALGATWVRPDYGALLQRARSEYRMRTALLCYDLIPMLHPEWCALELVRQFTAWFEGVIPACDHFFAISNATSRDLVAACAARFKDIPIKVTTIPIGTGFHQPEARPDAIENAGLPVLGSYVVYVSTIEARKNHALLFRVWQRLLEELPVEHVPDLVLAGRVGWLVSDLMRQIENTRYLNGKIRLIEAPSDADVEALYRGAMFSVLSSFSEGWGLPVSESLALGTPCVISNSTSLPEAGGAFARYFDPNSVTGAYEVIRNTLLDPDGLASWRARIAKEFRPTPWAATAQALIDGLFRPSDSPVAASQAEVVPQ